MLKETNLEAVKDIALSMLFLDIVQNKNNPFVVQHPFFNAPIAQVKTENGFEIVDITIQQNLEKVRKNICEKLDNITDYMAYLLLINKPYLPVFFKHTCNYLSEKDYSEFLGEMWCLVEFTNTDSEITPKDFLSYFQKANQESLMDEDELEKFRDLPEEITIYRGVKPKSTVNALSWTMEKSTAKWFADRFVKNGSIYEAKIKKEHILACFDRRDENEILVDYRELYDIKKISR